MPNIHLEWREALESKLRLIEKVRAHVAALIPDKRDPHVVLREIDEHATQRRNHPATAKTIEQLQTLMRLDGEERDARQRLERAIPLVLSEDERRVFEAQAIEAFESLMRHADRLESNGEHREASIIRVSAPGVMGEQVLAHHQPQMHRLATYIRSLEQIRDACASTPPKVERVRSLNPFRKTA